MIHSRHHFTAIKTVFKREKIFLVNVEPFKSKKIVVLDKFNNLEISNNPSIRITVVWQINIYDEKISLT
jgi:hypothetical protein